MRIFVSLLKYLAYPPKINVIALLKHDLPLQNHLFTEHFNRLFRNVIVEVIIIEIFDRKV